MSIQSGSLLLPLLLSGFLSFPVYGAEAQSSSDSISTKGIALPSHTKVAQITGSVTLDGEITESAWKQATRLTPFLTNQNPESVGESTVVLMGYDDQALYMAWTCEDSDIQASMTQRDSQFWDEEVAEFFITPNEIKPGQTVKYFELQWSPLNGVFDAIIENQLDQTGFSKGIKGEWGWTCEGMQSAVKVAGTVSPEINAKTVKDKDQQWQVEVRIPFAGLGVETPKSGDVWRANLYRFNRTADRLEMQSWSPTERPSFHEPSRFGSLEFTVMTGVE